MGTINITPKGKIDKCTRKFIDNLNEKQKRQFVGLEAQKIGHGGITKMSILYGMNRKTIKRGIKELNQPKKTSTNRIRKKGGGRKPIEELSPEILDKIVEIVEGETAGNPQNDRKWVRKSLEYIQKELKKVGYSISPPTISRLLKKIGLFGKI
jgi:transposase